MTHHAVLGVMIKTIPELFVMMAETVWYQYLYRLTDDLVAIISKHPLSCGIDQYDITHPIRENNAFGGVFKKRRQVSGIHIHSDQFKEGQMYENSGSNKKPEKSSVLSRQSRK
jgi:hypothetical protein